MDKATELKLQITNYLIELLEKDDFKKSLNLFINTELKNIIIEKKEDLLKSEVYKNIQMKIKSELLNTLKSSDFSNQMYTLIDNSLSTLEKSNKTLDKTIPPAIINSLKVYTYNHKDELIQAFKNLLSNKDIEKRILIEINGMMSSMNPMVARFVSANNIFSRLKSSLEDYLDDTKNILTIINFINKELDNIMKKTISDFSTYFPTEGRKSIINSLTNTLSVYLSNTNLINMLFSAIDEKLAMELSNANTNSLTINNIINDLTSTFINNTYEKLLINNGLKESIDNISEYIVENFLSKPLIDLI